MVQDVDMLIGKQSSYRITVNRVKCQVTVYAANETGNYCIPVKTFTCSVGKAGTPTHAGTYATLKKQNPVELMGRLGVNMEHRLIIMVTGSIR